MRRRCVLLTALAIAAGSIPGHGEAPHGPEALPRTHRTQAGVALELPPPETLGCEAIRETLGRLDRSGYRAGGLLGREHPDHPVFLYEDRLAARLFFDCTLPGMRGAAPGGLFSRGFAPERGE